MKPAPDVNEDARQTVNDKSQHDVQSGELKITFQIDKLIKYRKIFPKERYRFEEKCLEGIVNLLKTLVKFPNERDRLEEKCLEGVGLSAL